MEEQHFCSVFCSMGRKVEKKAGAFFIRMGKVKDFSKVKDICWKIIPIVDELTTKSIHLGFSHEGHLNLFTK